MKIIDEQSIVGIGFRYVCVRPKGGGVSWYIAAFRPHTRTPWGVHKIARSDSNLAGREALICYILDNYPEKIGRME
jgi:hypothetical protein